MIGVEPGAGPSHLSRNRPVIRHKSQRPRADFPKRIHPGRLERIAFAPAEPARTVWPSVPREPHEFSRDIQNLIADLRGVPGDRSRSYARKTHPLGESIDRLLQKYQIGPEAPEHVLRARWHEVVGNANAAYSHPVRFDKGNKLLVLVSHAVVRDELRVLEPVILQRVRQLPGCERVSALTLRAG